MIILMIVSVLILPIIARLLKYSLKTAIELLLNGIGGFVLLAILNFVLDLKIPLTPVTVIFVGMVGIPGVILLYFFY